MHPWMASWKVTATDNTFEKCFPHILESFPRFEITLSCYNFHDSFVFYSDLSVLSGFWHFQLGAKSGLFLLNLGKLHHLRSADVFLASIFKILVNTGEFKSLMAFTAWKIFNLMHASPCPTFTLQKCCSKSFANFIFQAAAAAAVKSCVVLLVSCPRYFFGSLVVPCPLSSQ